MGQCEAHNLALPGWLLLARGAEIWTWTLKHLFYGVILFVFWPMNLLRAPSHCPVATPQAHSQMRIFVWNIHGAGSGDSLNILREHIRMHNPSVVALVETRVLGSRAQAVCSKIGFRNCFQVEA